MNWIDFILAILLILNIIGGFTTGLVKSLYDLTCLVASLVVGLIALPVSTVALQALGLSVSLSYFIGFSAVFIAMQVILAIAGTAITKKAGKRIKGSAFESLNRLFGPLPQILIFLISMSFFLALLVSFPVANPIKSAIQSSKYGGALSEPAVRIFRSVSEQAANADSSNPI